MGHVVLGRKPIGPVGRVLDRPSKGGGGNREAEEDNEWEGRCSSLRIEEGRMERRRAIGLELGALAERNRAMRRRSR